VRGRTGDSFISPDVQRDRIAAWAVAHGHRIADFEGSLLTSVFWLALWSVLLLRRSRDAWWILAVVTAFGIVAFPLAATASPSLGSVGFAILYVRS
jgi:hypothetical protein